MNPILMALLGRQGQQPMMQSQGQGGQPLRRTLGPSLGRLGNLPQGQNYDPKMIEFLRSVANSPAVPGNDY